MNDVKINGNIDNFLKKSKMLLLYTSIALALSSKVQTNFKNNYKKIHNNQLKEMITKKFKIQFSKLINTKSNEKDDFNKFMLQQI